ncbi:Rieske (2Fe-2S) protein [Rhizobium paknamense]|uniref:Nitrite reductase/ring-hydroxylating ferredoxin subunit n=1 Tax=Rhizobium paknamense TaxID=1206817 RepID=A0ABU0IGT2_9HYPH|nr:Rieske (2Fe-2S) protein [Rhizobium paknamense]MDQ0456862.1 nitrite reductase/ring-hydroxylating ferredoxin subunit [Rhizobium paknamense]
MSSPLRSAWTPIALSADVPALTVMPARLGGETVALWRSAAGQVTVSADRCPHRGMRLSHGFVRGEALSCIYHGWSYATSGQCLKIPAHPGLTPPDAIRVETYAVTERDGMIWAANVRPSSQAPDLSDLCPLRSLSVVSTVEALKAAAESTMDERGLLPLGDAGKGVFLLLSAEGNGEILIHVLVPPETKPADRIAASRTVEALRRRAEALCLEGEAA